MQIFSAKTDFKENTFKCHGLCTLDNKIAVEMASPLAVKMSITAAGDRHHHPHDDKENKVSHKIEQLNQRWKEKFEQNHKLHGASYVSSIPYIEVTNYGSIADDAKISPRQNEDNTSSVLHRTVSPLQQPANNIGPTSTPMPMDFVTNGGETGDGGENVSIGAHKHSFGSSIGSSYQISSIHSPGNTSESSAFSPLPPQQLPAPPAISSINRIKK